MLFISFLVIFIISISCAYAVDNDTTDDVKVLSNTNNTELAGATKNAVKDTSFTKLENDIKKSNKNINLNSNYQRVKSENNTGIVINKSNIVIDGRGHTIDGKASSRIFDIYGKNVTLKNMVLANGNMAYGSAIFVNTNSSVTTINVTFRGCQNQNSGTVYVENAKYTSSNDKFIDCRSQENGIITSSFSTVVIKNAYMKSKYKLHKGFVVSDSNSTIEVTGSTFENTRSKYSTAILADDYLKVENCKFINLKSDFTSGAIAAKDVKKGVTINKCTFKNVTSSNNGGAVFIDIEGVSGKFSSTTQISNSNFTNCISGFGGAVLQVSGKLNVDNCNFINNKAIYDGGAIYTSNADVTIQKSTFNNNKVLLSENHGNALFIDRGSFVLKFSNLTSNTGGNESVYLYDTRYLIFKNIFKSNINAISAVFSDGRIDYNDIVKQRVSLKNTDYATNVDEVVTPLKIVNPSKGVRSYPDVYDYRKLGYVTAVKNQNSKNSCWSFGAIAALESSIVKATNKKVDLSENVIFNSMLKYSRYGETSTGELALLFLPVGSFVSWLGTTPTEYDEYDELSKISEFPSTDSNIHVQDVLMFDPLRSADNINVFKEALVKYGGIATSINANYGNQTLFNTKTGCFYAPRDIENNHVVCIVGWDDTISANNFNTRPAGDGAWIVKNSYGPNWEDKGYYYISYYDSVLLNRGAYCFIINNTVSYNKVYQTDVTGSQDIFLTPNNQDIIYYVNKYNMTDDDYIAAVGTYFNQSGVNYEIKIIVNDYIKHVQTGKSSFFGYTTIKLNKYVPVKRNDNIIVVVRSNGVPVQQKSRQHYMDDVSLYSLDEKNWVDLKSRGETVALKLYTVDKSSIKTSTVNRNNKKNGYSATFYDGYGEVLKNSNVTMTVNGKTYETQTNGAGVASFDANFGDEEYNITLYNPETEEEWFDFLDFDDDDEYVPTHTHNDSSRKTHYNSQPKHVRFNSQNHINVKAIASAMHKSIIIQDNYRAAFYDGAGNALKNKEVIIIVDGKEYKKVTDENGVANIDELLGEGTHQITIINPVTGEEVTYTIDVKPRIVENHDIDCDYNSSTTFKVRALDENGNPVSAGETVIFKINDKEYDVKTDESGYASIQLNNTVENTSIVSMYANYTTTNKINVK